MGFTTTPVVPAAPKATVGGEGGDARAKAISAFMTSQSSAAQVGTIPTEVAVAAAASNTSLDAPESPPVDTSVPDEATPVAPEKALSPQYAALARKEKAIRSQVQQLKAREAAQAATLQAREEAIAAREAKAQAALDLESRLDSDPLSVLAERGVSYDKLTQLALNPPSEQDQAIKELKAEIAKLKGDVDGSKKTFEDQQTNSYKQAVNQIYQDAKTLVSKDPQFETIRTTGNVRDVVRLIERTFKEDGLLLSVEEAAAEVENHLFEEGMKITKVKKFQQQYKTTPSAAPATPAQDVTKQVPKQQQQGIKTLTNAMSATRPLTAKERAVLAFKGELKS